MPKLLRHVIYKFPTYFVTLERATEQYRADEIEAAGEYVDTAPVTQAQRVLIDSGEVVFDVINGSLNFDAEDEEE